MAAALDRSHVAIGWQLFPTGMHVIAGKGFQPETVQHVAVSNERALAEFASALEHHRARYLAWRSSRQISVRMLDDIDASLAAREGIVQEVGIRLSTQTDGLQLMGLFRAVDQPLLGPDARAFLDRIAPHVDRVLHLARKQAEHAALARGLQAAFDEIAFGVLLLRADLSIIAMNRMARRILEGADGIQLRAGRVHIAEPRVQAWFGDEVQRAAMRADGGSSTRRIPRPQSRLPGYLAEVVAGEPGIAQVFLIDPAAAFRPSVARLQDYAGLSPMQAEIALCIARGADTRAVAEALGVSPHTVKTHLDRALQKLDCHDRLALTRTITALLSWLDR
ncbi:MAG: helix-turn-helix transcriptional regulator [Pseudomonadota bacterium]